MKNQIYRIEAGDGSVIEVQGFETNDTSPYVEKLQAGMYVKKGAIEIFADLDDDMLESLLDYLDNLHKYIKAYNKKKRESLNSEA